MTKESDRTEPGPSETETPAPDRIGPYRILERIGEGGMAIVYLAEQRQPVQRRVALKVMKPGVDTGQMLARFDQERQALSLLSHSHIARLYDAGASEDGYSYFAMEHVPGRGLIDYCDQHRVGLRERLALFRDICLAVDYAHEKGIIHRDLKPGNILVMTESDKPVPKIIDFGIAKAAAGKLTGQTIYTRHGAFVGSLEYASPEQAEGADDIDKRTDIYSLGCLLYKLLVGVAPLNLTFLSGPQAEEAIRTREAPSLASRLKAMGAQAEQIAEARDLTLATLARRLGGELDWITHRALEKEPARRYHSAAEFAADIDRYLADEAVLAGPVSLSYRATKLVKRNLGSSLQLAGILVLVLLVVGYLAVERFGSSSGGAPPLGNSIAVLPFVNMSDDAANEYFSDGISEELLNLLTRIPELRVISRSSAFSFKGKNIDMPTIAEQLNVAHILEGSVRKDGNRVRITAQLIDTRTDTHLWSATYERTLDDIFATQDEIAARVVEQLKITLLDGAPTVQASDPQAYALVLQARYVGRRHTPDALEKSITLLEQALAIDPDYAAAWVVLAGVYDRQAGQGLRPIDEGYRLAREAAGRALALDPAYASAHSMLGWITRKYDRDLAAAAKHYERALALEPANANNIPDAASMANALGQLDQAIALAEYAVARDPVSTVRNANLGLYNRNAGRLDEAIAALRTALTLSPGYIGAQYGIGAALLLKDEPRAALAAMQKEAFEGWRLLGLVMAHHALGQAAASDAALAEMIEKYEQGWPYNIAYVLAFRGEADRAFEWLDKAVLYNDPGLAEIAVEALFANIHTDPRWLPFLESIGKSPEQLAAIAFKVTLPD